MSEKRGSVMWLVAVGILCVVRVGAHHPVATVYDEKRTVTLEGEVRRLVDDGPHPVAHLVVRGDGDATRTWAVEFDSASEARQVGDGTASLRPGDHISVCGNPGRDPGQFRLRMLALERSSDGLRLRSGASLAASQCGRS